KNYVIMDKRRRFKGTTPNRVGHETIYKLILADKKQDGDLYTRLRPIAKKYTSRNKGRKLPWVY
ncbi:MAG: hypothetical protein KAH18_09500, partial [Psychromonas sp.]|nr:hypothetical protein [Psychromonas sp.]